MRRLLQALNPAFKLLSINALRTIYLNQAYDQAKRPIERLIEKTIHISFSVDGSSDGRHRDVTNLCFATADQGSYVLSTDLTEGADESAIQGAQLIKERLLKVTSNNLERVSSLAFDTLRNTTCPIQSDAQ